MVVDPDYRNEKQNVSREVGLVFCEGEKKRANAMLVWLGEFQVRDISGNVQRTYRMKREMFGVCVAKKRISINAQHDEFIFCCFVCVTPVTTLSRYCNRNKTHPIYNCRSPFPGFLTFASVIKSDFRWCLSRNEFWYDDEDRFFCLYSWII
jgi:hypothetical protein